MVGAVYCDDPYPCVDNVKGFGTEFFIKLFKQVGLNVSMKVIELGGDGNGHCDETGRCTNNLKIILNDEVSAQLGG